MPTDIKTQPQEIPPTLQDKIINGIKTVIFLSIIAGAGLSLQRLYSGSRTDGIVNINHYDEIDVDTFNINDNQFYLEHKQKSQEVIIISDNIPGVPIQIVLTGVGVKEEYILPIKQDFWKKDSNRGGRYVYKINIPDYKFTVTSVRIKSEI